MLILCHQLFASDADLETFVIFDAFDYCFAVLRGHRVVFFILHVQY